MTDGVTFIGFGEAGQAFARAGARAHDRKTGDPATRPAKLADCAASSVTAAESAADLPPQHLKASVRPIGAGLELNRRAGMGDHARNLGLSLRYGEEGSADC